MTETKKPTPADVERYLLAIPPSTPPEMIVEFMRKAPRDAWPVPSELQDILSGKLLRRARADHLVASLAGIKMREYRFLQCWMPESHWDRDTLREFIDRTIEEIC